MIGLFDSAWPEKPPAQVPKDLVEEMCRGKIEPLTEAGAISEGLTNLVAGGAMLVIGLVAAIYLFANPPSAADAAQDLAIFGWLGLLLLPLVPFTPILFLGAAVVGAGAVIYGLARASAAKAMGAAEFHCPKCRYVLALVRSRPKFEIVCPECYALIHAEGTRPIQEQRCDYCGMAYFAPHDAKRACPSCQCKPGASPASCKQCHQPVPKNVLFCRECLEWLGAREGMLDSYYFVGSLSATTCRAYLAELEVRVAKFTEQLEVVAEETTPGSISPQTVGSLLTSIEESLHLLYKYTLAAQWLYVKQERLPAEVVERVTRNALRIRDALQELGTAEVMRKRYDQQFQPIVKAAWETFAAAQQVSH